MNRRIVRLMNTSPLDIARGVKSVTKRIGNSLTKLDKLILFQDKSIKFSGKLICGKEQKHYRDLAVVESVRHWAQTRGVCFEIVNPDDFANVPWFDVSAVWLPLLHPGDEDYETRCKKVVNIPEHISLIADIRNNPNHPWLKLLKDYLSQHPLACRHVSPVETGDLFQLKVQLSHLPVELPHSDVRDVIMFDIHHWEDLSRHIQVLGLLEEFAKRYEVACKGAQCKLKFFLACFTSLNPFLSASENFIHASSRFRDNLLNVIRDNLIPPTETREEYLKLLSRTRLFITFHCNLTDMGLIEALANGIPTAILPNSLIEERASKLWVPNRYEIPGYDSWVRRVEKSLISIQGRDFSFLRTSWPSIKSKKILRSVFYHSWDSLWKWATGGE